MFTHTQAASFAEDEGLEVLWQTNAAVGFVCGADVAAALAVSFVKDIQASAGADAVRFVEVGNENYGKWEVPYPDHPELVNATAYGVVCRATIEAIQAFDASISVGCVGDLVDQAKPNTPFPDWNKVRHGGNAAAARCWVGSSRGLACFIASAVPRPAKEL